MSQDSAMRARVEGRDAVASRTMWQLNAGNGLRLRCVARAGDGPGAPYEVQGRTSKGWKTIGDGEAARELLLRAASGDAVASALRELAEALASGSR